jgi:hypothetical protein
MSESYRESEFKMSQMPTVKYSQTTLCSTLRRKLRCSAKRYHEILHDLILFCTHSDTIYHLYISPTTNPVKHTIKGFLLYKGFNAQGFWNVNSSKTKNPSLILQLRCLAKFLIQRVLIFQFDIKSHFSLLFFILNTDPKKLPI